MVTAMARRPLMDLSTVAKCLRFDSDEIYAWIDTKRVPCRPRASRGFTKLR